MTKPEHRDPIAMDIDTAFRTAAVLDFFGFTTPEQRDRGFGVNVKGVENIAEACADTGVRRLVHTSSNNLTVGDPINYFDFFRPIVEGIGSDLPRLMMPSALLYGAMAAWESLHWAIKIPPPPFTRLEVRKITVSHYSRIDKARGDLGWTPKVRAEDALEHCVGCCRELLANRDSVDRPDMREG
jgi:nucleoside-diphosphate-sugar epimerase